MADIVHFMPKAELDAEANLHGFIEVCRKQLTAFGKNLPFDDDVWDVTRALDIKAKNGASRIVFSTWNTVNDNPPITLSEPFLSFAKAYMRYQHAMRPTKIIGFRIAALRALDGALSENDQESHPTRTTPEILNRAAQLIQEKFSISVAYRVGGQLEMLANFLVNGQLVAVPVPWRSSISRPLDTVRVGQEFDVQRHAKLPSPAVLNALAKVFTLASEPPDVLVSSVAAILCCAPDRINEVLHLEVECEVNRKIPSTGEMAYGLRWRPSKGAEPMVKWIVKSMSDVLREALSNIRKLTEQARALASWCEEHPGKMYLPPHLEHLRTRERLTMSEMAEAIFAEPVSRTTGNAWCKRVGVQTVLTNRKLSVAFADVEAKVLAMLPPGFPVANSERSLKYSNALCLILRNALHAKRPAYRCAFQLLDQNDIGRRLGVRSATGITSIFDRFGFTEDDGGPICINTHQFRHYLNTLAQAGGMSQLDIAKWSGRLDVRQNKTYDHQSDRDVLALVREAVGDEQRMFGPLATLPKAALIPRDEFARLKVPTAHTTDFGYCIHDFTMLPCQIHRDCVNCDEQVCVKGDAVREGNIRRHCDETRALLKEALVAHEEGYSGTNRWIDHQQTTLARLEQLCLILDDPAIPAGSVIQLSGLVPASRLEQASQYRKTVLLTYQPEIRRSNIHSSFAVLLDNRES